MAEITVENITPETYTDDFVVDCARVSYAKRADQFTPEQNEKLIRYLFNPPDSVPHWAPFAGPRIGYLISLERNQLEYFLLNSNLRGFVIKVVSGDNEYFKTLSVNGSLWAWYENVINLPGHIANAITNNLACRFPVCSKVFGWEKYNPDYIPTNLVGYVTFTQTANLRIKAPIFVARQLVKHQADLVLSEVSRRYISTEPELWWPKEWHKAPTHSKQGASDELFDFTQDLVWRGTGDPIQEFKNYAEDQATLYNHAILKGMAPEEARMILPQNMMTEWIWTGTHDAFRRVLRERLAPGAQKSGTRETAEKIKQALNW